ncbi:MAG: hypothetical protein R3F53_27815 [Gammaproteobacteria bacterium]
MSYRIVRRETGLLVSVWLQKNKAPDSIAPSAAAVIADPLPATTAGASVSATVVKPSSGGTTVNIDLADTDTRFFAIIAAQSGIPIDVAPEIAMPISLRLMDIPGTGIRPGVRSAPFKNPENTGTLAYTAGSVRH